MIANEGFTTVPDSWTSTNTFHIKERPAVATKWQYKPTSKHHEARVARAKAKKKRRK